MREARRFPTAPRPTFSLGLSPKLPLLAPGELHRAASEAPSDARGSPSRPERGSEPPLTGQEGSVGRRKRSRHAQEGTGRPAKTNENAVLPTFRSVGQTGVRCRQERVRRRRDLPRGRPRAVRIGPGRRPGPSRTAPRRSTRSRERPEAGQEALRPPQSRPRAAKHAPRAPHNGFWGAQGGGGRASRALSRRLRGPFRQRLWYLWTDFGSPRGSSGTEKLYRRDHGVSRAQAEPNDWPAPSRDWISSTIRLVRRRTAGQEGLIYKSTDR